MRAYGCVWCFEKPSVIHETGNFYFDTKEVCYVNSEDGSESVSANAIGMGTKLSEFILKKRGQEGASVARN